MIVSILKHTNYENLQEAIEKTVEPLGGFSAFIAPGQKVFIKPNLLSDHPPEDAITTHPEIARAVIRIIRKLIAICHLYSKILFHKFTWVPSTLTQLAKIKITIITAK